MGLFCNLDRKRRPIFSLVNIGAANKYIFTFLNPEKPKQALKQFMYLSVRHADAFLCTFYGKTNKLSMKLDFSIHIYMTSAHSCEGYRLHGTFINLLEIKGRNLECLWTLCVM